VALLEAEPLQGRRHQIRRHLKHIAHPILGDATHGKGPLNRAVAAHLGQNRLWLHARSLSLRHPVSGTTLTLDAPLGEGWP
jgi:tRNA pseudouridine65 synthase